MGIVIQKFGGKLLETPELIVKAAQHVIKTKRNGSDPVVVVSALGQLTDQYQDMAYAITDQPDEREMDMLLSVGERIAMSLLAMAINAEGSYKAVSFTGSQVGIITDTRHTNARILEIKGYRIREAIAKGRIPIVAGFQGISTDREITTLGRGGSDATAVALAVAIGAERCELVKESGGVFTADPRIVEDAVLVDQMDYQALESITEAGAKIVQSRAASLANQHHIILSVTGTDEKKGTLVSDRTLTSCAVSSIVLRENIQLTQKTGLSDDDNNEVLNVDVKDAGISLRMTTKGRKSKQAIQVDIITIIGNCGGMDRDVVTYAEQQINKTNARLNASIRLPGRLIFISDAGEGSRITRMIHAAFKDKGYFERAEGVSVL